MKVPEQDSPKPLFLLIFGAPGIGLKGPVNVEMWI